MKKFWFGLVLALLASVSFASQMTLFKGSSGAGWDIPISQSQPDGGFKQSLEKDGLLKDGMFPTAVLTQIAYGFAKEQKLPAGELGEKEFKNLFLLANNFGETITVSEFRQLGQAGKIVLPDLVTRTATTKIEAPATQVAAAPTVGPTLPASPDAKQAVAIANMESQVKALRVEVEKSGSGQKEAAAVLNKQLEAFGKQLEALKKSQDGFAQKADLDEAEVEFAKLKGRVDALADLQAEVTGIKSSQSGFEGRLAAVEQNPILAWGTWLLAAIVIGFLLCSWVIHRTRNGNKADVKEVKAIVVQEQTKANATEAKAKEAMEKATEANATSLSAKQEAQAVAAEVTQMKKVVGYSKVQLPADFDAVLATLTKQGDSHAFCIKVGGQPFLIEVESNGSGMVKVTGIKEVTKPVNPKNLEDIIYRAAKLDVDGNHRIVGVPADSHLKAA